MSSIQGMDRHEVEELAREFKEANPTLGAIDLKTRAYLRLLEKRVEVIEAAFRKKLEDAERMAKARSARGAGVGE